MEKILARILDINMYDMFYRDRAAWIGTVGWIDQDGVTEDGQYSGPFQERGKASVFFYNVTVELV